MKFCSCDATRPQSRSQKEILNDPSEAGSFGTSTTGFQPEKLSGSPEMETLLSLDADGIVTAAFGQFYRQNCWRTSNLR